MRYAAALLLTAWATPAPAQQPRASAADLAFFEARVRPLLATRCYACHSAREKKQRGGLHLDSREAILKGGDSGPAVVPGGPDKSLLVQAVRYNHSTLHMPPDGKLPSAELAALEEWVRRGAPFPSSTETAAAKGIDIAAGPAASSGRSSRCGVCRRPPSPMPGGCESRWTPSSWPNSAGAACPLLQRHRSAC
jgi:hypothetical protein